MPADPDAWARALETSTLARFNALLMPDFALDHLIQFESLDDAIDALRASGGGGNVDVAPRRQMLRPGGGAANQAHALARLGVRARLVTATSPAGAAFLRATLGRDGVDLSGVRDDGALTVTGAIESPDSSLMLYTPGPHGALAPESLTGDDWDAIARADAVSVGDWANPRGADLMAEVWRVARQAGARTYTDPGMPPPGRSTREERLERLASPDLDAVSVNDDELRAYAPGHADGEGGLVEAGEALSERLHARVDLHSNALSASFLDGRLQARAAPLPVKARQATGAGDVWTVGIMVADLLDLPPPDRLLLANAVAALYVSSERAEPPTVQEVVALLRAHHDAVAQEEPVTTGAGRTRSPPS